jgi:hypothetical protein
MATTYDLSTFHTGVLPGGLDRQCVGLIQGGLAVGWTVTVKGVTARLVSPNKEKSLVFSASGKNIPYEQYKRIIHRHANPLLVDALAKEGEPDVRAGDVITAEQVAAAKPAPTPRAFVSADEDLVLPDDEPEVSDRKLVRVEPMIARRRQGKGYPSGTTNQRQWSDGSVDYACRFEGCDYESPNRKSVGAHWRLHVHGGDVEKQVQPHPTVAIEEYEVAHREGYTPRRERVSALAEVLAALDIGAMSHEDLAEFVLNWQHEQSTSGTRLAAEREDLTSDDILNRIRALLDNGTYLRQRDEIAALQAGKTQAEADLYEALTRAQDAEDKWTALRELIA